MARRTVKQEDDKYKWVIPKPNPQKDTEPTPQICPICNKRPGVRLIYCKWSSSSHEFAMCCLVCMPYQECKKKQQVELSQETIDRLQSK